MNQQKTRTIIAFVVIVSVLLGVAHVRQQYVLNQALNRQLVGKIQHAANNKRYNQKVTSKINANQLYPVTQNTINKSVNFYDLFLNWSSWAQYSQHLTAIDKQFPVIAKGKVVDTSTFTVGSGDSGSSTYSINNTYISPIKGSIVQLVTQVRQFDTTSATTQWFVTSRSVGNNQLEISSMKAIQADR